MDKSPPFLTSAELLVRRHGSYGAVCLDARRGNGLELDKPLRIKIAPFDLFCRKRDGFGSVRAVQHKFDQRFIAQRQNVFARLLQQHWITCEKLKTPCGYYRMVSRAAIARHAAAARIWAG